jgi:hypothetical protein
MGGRASLFLVMGFSLIFMVAGSYFNRMATSTTENFTNYYSNTKAHYIANAGVNLVVNKLFLDATIVDQTFNWSYDGGTISATLVTIDAVKNIKRLICTATYFGVSNSIKIIFKPSMFSKYAYFSGSEGSVYWTSSDTVWGPFHTNGNINIANHPVFLGRATIGGKESLYDYNSSARYYGGFQKGVQITIPATGVSAVQSNASGGASFTGQSLVYFEFRGDSVRYRYSTSGTGSTWTYKLASTFSPNGVISFANAEVHLSGTVKGRYSVVASGSTGNQGSFYLEDNIVYNTNPQTNSSSTDMLGIVAQNNIIVTNNTANNSSIKIQATMYCQSGSFSAQNYDTRPVSGYIDLYGGVIQSSRGAVGTFSGSTINHGFSKRYRYDSRLLDTYPPYFPGCGTFEVVSWYE